MPAMIIMFISVEPLFEPICLCRLGENGGLHLSPHFLRQGLCQVPTTGHSLVQIHCMGTGCPSEYYVPLTHLRCTNDCLHVQQAVAHRATNVRKCLCQSTLLGQSCSKNHHPPFGIQASRTRQLITSSFVLILIALAKL